MGKKRVEFQLIAASVLVIQSSLELKAGSPEPEVMKRITALHEVYTKNSASPRAQADLAKIFG